MSTINVLCLHGCRQTNEMFRSLLKEYVRIGEKDYNLKFFFLEAMYDYPEGGKTWYNQPLDLAEIGIKQYDPVLVRECMEQVERTIDEHQISVLFGFSQGGNVVDTFLRTRPNSIKKAVIVSGYQLVYPEESSEAKKLHLPLFSVYSHEDPVVLSKFRPADYDFIQEIVHPKGHIIPNQKTTIREICKFMVE